MTEKIASKKLNSIKSAQCDPIPQHTGTRQDWSDNLNSIEAAQYLRISKSSLDKSRVYGNFAIPYTKIGRRVVYRRADLDAYMDKNSRTNTGYAAG